MSKTFVAHVTEKQELNNAIERLSCLNDIVVDVPTNILTIETGESLHITILDSHSSPLPAADLVMQGQAYQYKDGFVYVSCGGMLSKLPCSDLARPELVDMRMRIAFRKNRRRQR